MYLKYFESCNSMQFKCVYIYIPLQEVVMSHKSGTDLDPPANAHKIIIQIIFVATCGVLCSLIGFAMYVCTHAYIIAQ